MPNKPKPKYKCTQLALYSICNLAWDNCLANLADFATYKAKYIAGYVTGKKTGVTNASILPDDVSRDTVAELARIALIPLNDKCGLNFQKLKGYIEDGFAKAQWGALFEAAGQTYYQKSSNENWEYTVGMNNHMIDFISANTVLLTTPGGMPAGFAAGVTTDSTNFNLQYTALKTGRETGVGTGTKIDANNAIYEDMMAMCRDGFKVYPTDAEKQALFTFKVLKNIVSPPGSASLKVTVQRPDGSFVVNEPVAINSEDEPPITVNTNASGVAQFDGIDPDRYNVTLIVPTFVPVDIDKDVDTGVNARMVVNLIAI